MQFYNYIFEEINSNHFSIIADKKTINFWHKNNIWYCDFQYDNTNYLNNIVNLKKIISHTFKNFIWLEYEMISYKHQKINNNELNDIIYRYNLKHSKPHIYNNNNYTHLVFLLYYADKSKLLKNEPFYKYLRLTFINLKKELLNKKFDIFNNLYQYYVFECSIQNKDKNSGFVEINNHYSKINIKKGQLTFYSQQEPLFTILKMHDQLHTNLLSHQHKIEHCLNIFNLFIEKLKFKKFDN